MSGEISSGPVKLDDHQLSELRDTFSSFDRNNDGSLTQLELGSLLRSLGLNPSTDQLDSLIQKTDLNSNGLISEFFGLVKPDLLPAKCPYTEDQLGQIFRMFDKDGNGYTAAAQVHSMAWENYWKLMQPSPSTSASLPTMPASNSPVTNPRDN